ncbi:aspartate aminotransferase family protein [Variovorax sp. NFACC27]|uniref:aspartate aminotransferase family protein n=1 Tax=unclassified Variovorax TaxID=663243 RepID=UPI00089B12C0|nr:Adenosylmethionine-8-amino-7-oxononanoate aminotransferase [Variovorax sp. NFACC28]SEG49295.1 Adenosylmethionine-8-amino-7-oxononanoate aminotransferase [Variovorax sp. NFACC29]SFC22401.1 Adenosylmethionine-8-amino-7-oxononanoate aminotransferase [Variovorax sp. NFACC26]SFH09271.1 Adenosylmethionine-8-amino-7-oxononanoate aminotransferase [Variovorax sp. NFACC27]
MTHPTALPQQAALDAIDRAHLIHPVSPWRVHEQRGPTVLASGKGAWLTDGNGHRLLDAFAGLWCVNVGYGQESVVQAATEQMRRLPYATGYFHFSSEPAIRLAEKLVQITPASLTRVYLTLGGSEAVDAAVRFVVQYYNATGRPSKKQFISLERGYHGSSSTGAGLTALPAFHRGFDLPLPTQHYIASPYAYRHEHGDDPRALIASSVAALRAKVAELGADNVAAFFCEPIQGSGGVVVPPKGWLTAMRDAARELDILFVVDEVITGFGRTGPMFACEAEGVEPDLMTMAKGLTAGYVPMGATMMSEKVYAGIADGAPEGAAIGHGATYSAHPVGAAVALEVLRLYEEGGILANGQRGAAHFVAGLDGLLDHPLVGDSRHRGLLGALELVSDKASKRRFDASLGLSDRIFAAGYRNGLVFRSFGDHILGFAPALTFTEDEFAQLFARLRKTLDEVLEAPDVRAALAA